MNVDISNNNINEMEPLVIEISGTRITPPSINNGTSLSPISESLPFSQNTQRTTVSNLERLLNLPPINSNNYTNIWNNNPIHLQNDISDISFNSMTNLTSNQSNTIFERLQNTRRARRNIVFPSRTNLRRRNVHLRRSRLLFNAINTILSNETDTGGINSLTNRVLQQSLYQDPFSFKQVLNSEGKKSIVIKKYDDSYSDKKCPITCMDFKIGDEIAELPCKHIFTPDSIMEWLEKEKAECPICRHKLESKEIKNEDTILEISNNRVRPFLFPPTNNVFPTSQHNETTDIDLQRAILRSIQLSNEQNTTENTTTENTTTENTTIENTTIENTTSENYDNSYDGWDSDEFDEIQDSESVVSEENQHSFFNEIFDEMESDIDSENDSSDQIEIPLYSPLSQQSNTQSENSNQDSEQENQEENDDIESENNDIQEENLFYESDIDIDDFFNLLFQNPVDEEIV